MLRTVTSRLASRLCGARDLQLAGAVFASPSISYCAHRHHSVPSRDECRLVWCSGICNWFPGALKGSSGYAFLQFLRPYHRGRASICMFDRLLVLHTTSSCSDSRRPISSDAPAQRGGVTTSGPSRRRSMTRQSAVSRANLPQASDASLLQAHLYLSLASNQQPPLVCRDRTLPAFEGA